jgi:RNA polymerase sigma factor (sigma-70 family)
MLRFLKKNTNEESDLELLQKYKDSSDLYWLGLLFERYTSLIYGVCLKYLKNEQAAEDACLGVFESLVEKAIRHDISNFKSWLHVLTKNYCLMEIRKNNRRGEQTTQPEIMHSLDQRHHIIEMAEEDMTKQHLKTCIDQLSIHQKDCIEAFYFEGYTYKEIAEARAEDLGKVRSYIQNGRRNLKNCLEQTADKLND